MARDPQRLTTTADDVFDQAWRKERPALIALATRMLTDRAAAEDAVQEAFDRFARQPPGGVDNPGAWLTVVVRRLCLNRLRSAFTRQEDVFGDDPPESASLPDGDLADPADRVTLDDQVQLALSFVLGRLSPAERTSFVLHDVFGFTFDEIAELVGRTPAACRQLASRARRSLRGADPAEIVDVEPATRSLVTERFIAACSGGRLDELLAVLDPDVVGEASMLGGGPLGHAEGADRVAQQTLRWFGPDSGAVLVPLSIEGHNACVAVADGGPFAICYLDESEGRINHMRVHVSQPRDG